MEHEDLHLIIQLRDGKPYQHPIFYGNFCQAFPELDPDNLPADRFARFVRVAPPQLGLYDVYEGTEYEWVGDVIKDVHKVRPMTDEEKAAKQQKVKDAWATRPQAENWAAWTFDESICNYVPPTPRPDPVEGKIVFWCGADNDWKEAPPHPTDGKRYRFDFLAWQWVEVTSVK